MRVGYMRLNPAEENEKVMVGTFKQTEQLERVYWDKISVKSKERAEYDKMMDYIRKGDELIVPEFARFNKTLIELVKTIETLKKAGVTLISKKEEFNSSTEEGQLKMQVMKSIAEFEKAVLRERQKEGIAAAIEAGTFKGYNEKKRPEDFNAIMELYRMKHMTIYDIAEFYKVSRPTVYKWIKQFKAIEDTKETAKKSKQKSE